MTSSNERKQCQRCPQSWIVNTSRASAGQPLCRDCRDVLTPAEQRLWGAKTSGRVPAPVVSSAA